MFPGIDAGTYKTPPTPTHKSVAEAWNTSLDGKVPYAPSVGTTSCEAPDALFTKSPHANL